MKNCSINHQCNKCKSKHNITICEDPRKLDPNTKKDSNIAPIIQDTETLTTLNESRHSNLLQTAHSKVFNNELSLISTAHIMFDSSSQKSHITADLKKKLHLKTIRNEKVIMKAFGSTERKVPIVSNSQNLKIKCRNKEFVNIEAFCVPAICSPLLGQKPFEISKIHTEFRKLYLADFKPNIEEKNISILIGLDYYFSFIKGNVIRSENDNLVVLESKLGWILSGTHETSERIYNTHIHHVYFFSQKPKPINYALNKFLKIESSFCQSCMKFFCVFDIKQAFVQIEVSQSHRDFLRFLWYDSITADNLRIVAFRFIRILFGLNSSPFSPEGTLQMHLSKYDFTYHDIDLVRKLYVTCTWTIPLTLSKI